jgi:hypothetical protein
MKNNIKKFIQDCNEILLLPDPVLEFGDLGFNDGKQSSDLKEFFINKRYFGYDCNNDIKLDDTLNTTSIKIPDNSVGTVICCDILDRIINPMTIISEFKRILKPDGIVIITSENNFKLTNFVLDYCCFTPECFKLLLTNFKYSNVQYTGCVDYPRTVIGIASDMELKNIIKLEKNNKIVKTITNILPKVLSFLYNIIKK